MSPCPRLTDLPPELLSHIFLPSSSSSASPPSSSSSSSSPCSPSLEPFHLHPSAIPIARALLPFTRANAYSHITVVGAQSLALLGETVHGGTRESGKRLGGLVRCVEVTSRGGGADEEGEWEGAERAFEGLSEVEEVRISLVKPETLLTASVLSTAAFNPSIHGKQGGVKLVITGDDPVSFAALEHLGKARGVREVVVRGAMRIKTRGGEGMFADSAGIEVEGGRQREKSRVERVTIESEAHAAGFIPFLESTSVKSLILRTYTTDAGMIFPSFGPKTRLGLEELAWTTMGYQQRPLELAFLALPALTHLTLRCPSFSTLRLTPAFLLSLSSLPHLHTLRLSGPSAGGAEDTVEMLADWVESLAVSGRKGALRTLGVEVGRETVAVVGQRRRRGMGRSAVEVQARRFVEAAGRIGVEVEGNVLELLVSAEE